MTENQNENSNNISNPEINNKNITNLYTMPTFNTTKYNYKSLLTTNNFKGFITTFKINFRYNNFTRF